MTIQMDANEVLAAIEVASWVGSIVAMLVIGLLVYLMVRPSRRRRERQRSTEINAVESEQMIRLIERMEQRLEVLERLVVQDSRHQDRHLEAGDAPPAGRSR